ncbi:MAG: S9 family peptidase [Thermoflexales bacterium]|nr:S9 family peptidase [Thermoflexales bacterium]
MEEYSGQRALPLPNPHVPEGLWPELVVAGWERAHNHAVAPNGSGQVAFYLDRGGYSELHVVGIEGPAFARRLTIHRPHVNWWSDEPPVWSPDGAWLIYGAYDSEGVSHLYVVAADGGPPRALTELRYDAYEPALSPDGRWVAFTTEQSAAAQIALVAFEGGWVRGLTHGDEECSGPTWSPDGRHILYAASPTDTRHSDLYVISPEGGAPTRLTPGDGAQYWNGVYAPDGSRIALQCNRSGFDELWIMRPDGSGLRQLTRLQQDIEDFAWSPDGTRLLIVGGDQGNDPIYVVDADSGATRPLALPAGNYSAPRWVDAGTRFVVGYDSPQLPPALYLCDSAAPVLQPLTDTAAGALKQFPFVTPRHITYTGGDGWQIPAFVYLPEGVEDARGAPGLIYPHGGPNAQYDLSWDPVRQYFVARGYAIICPNFRGSTGYGRLLKEGNLFDWGRGDLADCLAAADALVDFGGVDANRLAMWGQSYGGYLTWLALTRDHRHRLRCGVALYGDTHLKTSWARGDHPGRQDVEWQMGHPSQAGRRYEAASPLNDAASLQVPVLVLHGERDTRVALGESLQMVDALRRLGKTFEFKTYPDEGHGFAHPENALDALRRIERFLDWHLL